MAVLHFVGGWSRPCAELGKALGVTMPFTSLTLHMEMDAIVSATVTFPVERSALEAAGEVVKRYRMQLVEVPDEDGPIPIPDARPPSRET